MSIKFISQTANGSSDVFVAKTSGRAGISIYGTWDTATMAIEQSADNGTTWNAIASGSFTSDTVGYTLDTFKDYQYRFTLSSVGGSTSLNAYLQGLSYNGF